MNPEIDPVKLKAALARYDRETAAAMAEAAAEAAARGAAGTGDGGGDALLASRKRGYNSLSGSAVTMTAEDVEAFALKRARAGDPMAEWAAKQEAKRLAAGGAVGDDEDDDER